MAFLAARPSPHWLSLESWTALHAALSEAHVTLTAVTTHTHTLDARHTAPRSLLRAPTPCRMPRHPSGILLLAGAHASTLAVASPHTLPPTTPRMPSAAPYRRGSVVAAKCAAAALAVSSDPAARPSPPCHVPQSHRELLHANGSSRSRLSSDPAARPSPPCAPLPRATVTPRAAAHALAPRPVKREVVPWRLRQLCSLGGSQWLERSRHVRQL